MIGIPLGMLAGNGIEWLVHKYVLHGLGRKKGTFWSFHWHEHHRACRQHGHLDGAYAAPRWAWDARTKEVAALGAAGVAFLPLLPLAPWFVVTLWGWGLTYYRVHKKAHLDPAWARARLPWHYDHHMGPDQDANWCVVVPWFDWIMGTREAYLGTEREARDTERRAARAAARAG